MKKIYFIFSVLFCFVLDAQNLIPNGDFEFYTSCPSLSSQLPLAMPWTAAPNNSIEYFNACNNSFLNVPYQSFNYQQARSGQAFMGFWFMNGTDSYREYAQTQLISQLLNNNYYLTTFYVNRHALSHYAVNNIAGSFQASFTTTNSVATNSNVIAYTTDVIKFGNPIIQDTIDWIKIQSIYKANGNETYFLIGNFKYDYQTDTLGVSSGNYYGAYYFIDDVSVENIISPQWSYRDTAITLGDIHQAVGPGYQERY